MDALQDAGPRMKLPSLRRSPVWPLILSASVAFLGWIAPSVLRADEGPNTIVVFSSTIFAETKVAAHELVALGADIFDVYAPRVYFVQMSPQVRNAVRARSSELGIELMATESLKSHQMGFLEPDIVFAAEVWNELLRGIREDTPERRAVSFPFGEGPPLRYPTSRNPRLTATRTGMHSPPFGSVPWTLSEFMIGNPTKIPNILVNVIFPESTSSIDSNLNDWTNAERVAAATKVTNACNWWKARAPACLRLSFMVSTFYVSTGYEPILHPTDTIGSALCPGDTGQGLWISQVIEALEPSAALYPCYFDKVVAFSDKRRTDPTIDTDWSLTIFIVQDTVDPNPDSNGNGYKGEFPDGRFAFAYLGGPFIVMTRSNDGYQLGNMDAVCAHEMGHSFWALDEYCGASFSTERSGYLNIVNGNYCGNSTCPATPGNPCPCPPPACNPILANCIMGGGTTPFGIAAPGGICAFTKDMVGWRDWDGDGSPDITDTNPTVSYTSVPSSPTALTLLPYAGDAQVSTTPNINSQPSSTRLPMTVNTIISASYTVDSGAPTLVNLVVPPYDSGMEAFTFTALVTPSATHVISAYVNCTAGCFGQMRMSAPVSSTVTVTFPLPPVTTCP